MTSSMCTPNVPRNLRSFLRQVHAVVRRFKEINQVQIIHFDSFDDLRDHVKREGLGDGLLVNLRPRGFLSIYSHKKREEHKPCEEADNKEEFPDRGVKMCNDPLDLLTPAQKEWRRIRLQEINQFLQQGESHAQGGGAQEHRPSAPPGGVVEDAQE